MDRVRTNCGNKNQKKMSNHSGSEFYILGTKGSRDEKSKMLSGKSADRKRESSSMVSSCATKKQKLSSARSSGDGLSGEFSSELWEQMATDWESFDLMDSLITAIEHDDNDNVLRMLCSSAKYLLSANSRTKMDFVLYITLLYVSKIRPKLFSNEIITPALVSVLRREQINRAKQFPCSHVIATNLLARGFSMKPLWPEIFLKAYIEDAVNERFWTDTELCAPFVENICSAFQTRIPTANLLQFEGLTATPSIQQHREIPNNVDDDSGDNSIQCSDVHITMPRSEIIIGLVSAHRVKNRYFPLKQTVEKYVIDAVKEHLNKRQQQDCYTRNFLKFLCSASGLAEVRYLCSGRLELWIHNAKLVKFAQQLLSYICYNLTSTNFKDQEVLATLVKMRLKTKPLINFYMACIKEIIILENDILFIMLKMVIQNELSNTRNPNNMGMLATMFQTCPVKAAGYLAEIYKEFLLQRDDCLRTLRVFLRELVRMLRYEINILKFCRVFLEDRPEITKQIEVSEFRDRIFHSIVDITCLCMLLSVSPQVREANMSFRYTRELKNNSILAKFYGQLSQIQLFAVSWMYETVPNAFKIKGNDYNQALHKILLLEIPEQYSRSDQWPSEPERATLLRIISETPVHEEALLRIILIGITKDIPFTIPDTIDIIMLVIKRASAMRNTSCPAVQTNKFDIIDFLFSMSEYHHPENIMLPVDYNPPKLAITVLYWKAWTILLMISAHNPSTFGAFCWDHYPTMKMLIEMCITNQFNESSMTRNEIQIQSMERQHILEFEAYLAAQTSQAIITEENAILISQLMLMDPMGPARRIPSAIVDQLVYLNKSLKLGHLLCRSRKPDLLLDIIQRNGTTQSMPWLSDLVQNSDGDFDHLPVQCLCEFLLFNADNINEENSRDAESVNFLRKLVFDPKSDKEQICEVLDYIFRRLSSTVKHSRVAALGGIKIIFKCSDLQENNWLLTSIPLIAHFENIRVFIIPQLRSACQVENSPELVMSYIQFIAAHTLNDSVNDMLDHVLDMAQLIVERSTMFQHIVPASRTSAELVDNLHDNRLQTLKCLFVMFNNYIIKLREHQQTFEWMENADLIMVQFDDGVLLPLHINIIHALIILLTYSNYSMPESVPILDYWFPLNRPSPNAYLPNLPQEHVQLLPDWLKLKMIRSPVERLIEVALQQLSPDQIVLFVQNFGTPVNSMSKLLALLDHAVIEQFDVVKNAILNKAYLAQLIEIQQTRGAKNGHFTVQALGLHSHSQTVPDLPRLCSKCMKTENVLKFPLSYNDTFESYKEIDQVIALIIKFPELNFIDDCRFRNLVHQLLLNSTYISDTDKSTLFYYPNKKVVFLLQLIELPTVPEFRYTISQMHYTFTLFRVILKLNALSTQDIDVIIDTINKRKNILEENIKLIPSLVQFSSFFSNLLSIVLQKKNVTTATRGECDAPYQHKSTSSYNLVNKIERENECKVNKSFCNDGLFVDWLSKVDPELKTLNENLKENYLFSKKCGEFRFYLLSLICHQTSWGTLISTLNLLFHQSTTVFDNSSVLNFIEAIINNPKLWQGRDKCVSKSCSSEILFLLNKKELSILSQFILKEGTFEIDYNTAKYDYTLCSRINLFFMVANINRSDFIKFVKDDSKNSCKYSLRCKVLQQMYLMYPPLKFLKYNLSESEDLKLKTLKGCKVDKISNYLITCLGNLFLKKDFEAISSDTELLIRKLAASHSDLFLRQLGVLVSLIQGKSLINLRSLREEYHFHRFIQILRTLELLQPMIFDDIYKDDFQKSLECYFNFFKHHNSVKEAHYLLLKFIELLQTYINTNPSSAFIFIEQYVGLLMELALKFNSIAPLHQLVQGIALLQHKNLPSNALNDYDAKQEFDIDEQYEIKNTNTVASNFDAEHGELVSNSAISQIDVSTRSVLSFTISGSYNKCILIEPHFLHLIKIVKHSNVEDSILGPLQEIESITSKRFLFLSELFDRLLELIFSPSAQIRSNAFILLIRHLKHDPGRSDLNKCTFNSYIQCLRDENSSVAATAVDNLADMVVLLQEYAVEILSVAFSLGIKSHLNTCTQIKRVLQTLMLQHGY